MSNNSQIGNGKEKYTDVLPDGFSADDLALEAGVGRSSVYNFLSGNPGTWTGPVIEKTIQNLKNQDHETEREALSDRA